MNQSVQLCYSLELGSQRLLAAHKAIRMNANIFPHMSMETETESSAACSYCAAAQRVLLKISHKRSTLFICLTSSTSAVIPCLSTERITLF